MSRGARRGQSGLSIVELTAALAVTTIVLGGIALTLQAAAGFYERSQSRVGAAAAGDRLGTALAADGQRYLACPAPGGLDFEVPGGGEVAVSYRVQGAGPYAVVRSGPLAGGDSAVAATLAAAPGFGVRLASPPAPGVTSGTVVVSGLRYAADSSTRPPLSVYFRSPAGGGCA